MWETPIWAGVSLRLPVFTQTPTAALSSPGIGSLTTVKPLESLEISRVMRASLEEMKLLYQRQVLGAESSSFSGRSSRPDEPGRVPAAATPMASVTASGNLAGWAVERITTGDGRAC